MQKYLSFYFGLIMYILKLEFPTISIFFHLQRPSMGSVKNHSNSVTKPYISKYHRPLVLVC
jgi:hypothetical protein